MHRVLFSRSRFRFYPRFPSSSAPSLAIPPPLANVSSGCRSHICSSPISHSYSRSLSTRPSSTSSSTSSSSDSSSSSSSTSDSSTSDSSSESRSDGSSASSSAPDFVDADAVEITRSGSVDSPSSSSAGSNSSENHILDPLNASAGAWTESESDNSSKALTNPAESSAAPLDPHYVKAMADFEAWEKEVELYRTQGIVPASTVRYRRRGMLILLGLAGATFVLMSTVDLKEIQRKRREDEFRAAIAELPFQDNYGQQMEVVEKRRLINRSHAIFDSARRMEGDLTEHPRYRQAEMELDLRQAREARAKARLGGKQVSEFMSSFEAPAARLSEEQQFLLDTLARVAKAKEQERLNQNPMSDLY